MLNFIIIISGKGWLYNAVYITYLKGHKSSYIHDYVYFPSKTVSPGEHQKWPNSQNYNQAPLPKFIEKINTELETTALLVIKNDSIIFEQYWDGYHKDSASNSFSMAKSWVSTLIGVALKEGEIRSVDEKVCNFLPNFCEGKNADLSIKNLLTMSAGLNWEEDYYNPIGQTAEAYYGNNLSDLMNSLTVIEVPGKTFKYHSSCTQLLTFILEAATEKTISEYSSEKLWAPMGAKQPALWSTDVDGGNEKGFCCLNSNARDFARLGKLYLNQGNWNGVQLLDSNYVKAATSPANLLNEKGEKNTNYGFQFWLAERNGFSIYYARGLWGQYMICIPEKNIILVRLGRMWGEYLNDGHHNDFYAFVDAALKMYP